jgi:glycosyltransferase involved in cell wall biosynthesis
MSKKILIASLQYSPIHKSLSCALGNQCEKFGYNVKYLFSFDYKWMLTEDKLDKTFFIGRSNDIFSAIKDGLNYQYRNELTHLITEFKPDYIYLFNIHPIFNYFIANMARKMNIILIQHIHEPYVEDKRIYGITYIPFLYIFEFFQGLLLYKTDIVVLSSQRALYLLNKRYKYFKGKIAVIPLMYEDLGKSSSPQENRKFITFIGPPVPSKSPETFLKIIDYSNEHALELKFLLITRKEIDDNWQSKKGLTIFFKNRISDEEIGYYQKQSLMVITPYKVGAQSAVAMTSLMYGTPVLSTDVGGLKEAIIHLNTGFLLNNNSTTEDWIRGISYIKENFKYLSINCRNYFLNNFSEINWSKYFEEIFNHECAK